jgi:hypothetical protein
MNEVNMLGTAQFDPMLNSFLVPGMLIVGATLGLYAAWIGQKPHPFIKKWATQHVRYGCALAALAIVLLAMSAPFIEFGIQAVFDTLDASRAPDTVLGWCVVAGWAYALAFPALVVLTLRHIHRHPAEPIDVTARFHIS